MRCTRLFLLSISALALSLSAFAQTTAFAQTADSTQTPLASKDSKEEQEKLQKALEGKALKLLESTIADAQSLKLAENQAMFKATGADLLWPRDEKRARSLFQDASRGMMPGRTTLPRSQTKSVISTLAPAG